MTTPSQIFTEMVVTTLREHPTELTDAVSNHNAVWRVLNKRGNIERIDGGYEIVEPLMYPGNSNYQRYDGFEQLGVGATDDLSAAKYDWKQAATTISVSGKDMRNNKGRNRLIPFAESKVKKAKLDMRNGLTEDTYSDGTADNGKQVGGLQQILTQTGLGTIGGIPADTFPFWRNQFKDGAGATVANIGVRMNDLWLTTTRGSDRVDTIMSANDLYSLFWSSLTANQRYSDEKDEVTAGFDTLKFISALVFHDGGSGIPDTTQYWLNTDYIKIVVHEDADMEVVEDRVAYNQDAVTIPIIWQGNLVCSNRARQGIFFD